LDIVVCNFNLKGGILPQLRQNIITGEWVVMAPERAKRPNDYVTTDTVRYQSKTDCNFCVEKNIVYSENIKKYETDHVYVVPNKFPAFVEKNDDEVRSYKVEDGFYRGRPSTGGHDVIVVKEHDMELPKFTKTIWVDLLETFKKRYEYFDKEKNVAYTMPIYNHGREAGASIEHPHAQIFASNIVPNEIAKELHHTEKYFEHNGVCAFCDLIKHEKEFNQRIVFENSDFVAFTFYAARFPFEVWVLPKNHMSRFENETNAKFNNLAECLMDVFGKLNKTLNDPPLNFFIHNLPNTSQEADYYHWHLEIAPRITGYGGFEMGSGTIIDVFSPEVAAKFLRGEK
jgi:UDPglucose--hexose-1-phosphate uridylyltransferase